MHCRIRYFLICNDNRHSDDQGVLCQIVQNWNTLHDSIRLIIALILMSIKNVGQNEQVY